MGRWLLVLAGCGRLGFEPRLATDDATPSDAPPVPGFSELVAYADQTCATFEGKLYCWGENALGQIGDGTTMDRGEPTIVGVPTGVVSSFAQGEKHACAVVDDALHCWGAGFAVDPAAVELPAAARLVDAGRDFTCALADRLYCWGENSDGRCGDSTTQSKPVPTPVATALEIVQLDLGDDHGCALAGGGGVICWGHNDNGTFATGSFTPSTEPTPVPALPEVTQLPRIAGWHACSLQAGEVRCWGRNTEGALGNGNNADSATPVLLANLPPVDVIATGGGPTDFDATCAASGGEVRCWGAGGFGRLGNGLTSDSNLPQLVDGLPGADVRALALGYAHSCAIVGDGELWCWGRGTDGQLGDGKFADSLTPVQVALP